MTAGSIVPALKPKRLVPRDAATLVLVDRSVGRPRILMGRRRADLAFLANKFVFPGGRVDAGDRAALSTGELDPVQTAKLMTGMRGKPSPVRARALAMAAVRETREETGLVLGDGGRPNLRELCFFARAITPPQRPRRYDTRFFMTDAAAVSSGALGGDGELVQLAWFTLDEARALELPGITRLIIEDIAEVLAARSGGHHQVPFYYHRGGTFRRDLL